MDLELLLKRTALEEAYTGGELSVEKKGRTVVLADTLEDTVREFGPKGEGKIRGETAIPAGRYQVIFSYSQRFKKVLPEVLNVPFFSGIRIHVGNWTKDTDGCILVGLERKGSALVSSRAAMKLLTDELQKTIDDGGNIFITIVNK